jgi:uncharacterized protein YecT (DUF1311 family)
MTADSNRYRSSVLGLTLATLAVVLVAPRSASGQAAGEEGTESAAFASCQTLAARQDAALRLRDEGLEEQISAGKVGSQVVGMTLAGQGVRQAAGSEPVDVRFLCLLESSDKALFFEVIEEGRHDPVAACWDAFQPAAWGPLTDCLEEALKREEATLAAALAKATEQAGRSMDAASAKKTLDESNAQWARYRDSECDRQQAFVAGRNHPDIGELTCRIRETAERVADIRFDDE